MTRIAASSLAELVFRQNDTPPTRAQKLELLKALLGELWDEFSGHTHPDLESLLANIYRIPGYFTTAPAAGATLHLHSLVQDVYFYPDFAGSEAHMGQPPAADYICTIYRNPVMDGTQITGGQVIGTVTFTESGGTAWETADNWPVQLFDGDVIGVKAPAADADIRFGSFTLFGWIGFAANTLAFSDTETDEWEAVLLSGDQTDGDDLIMLSGDEQFDEIDPATVEGLDASLLPQGPQGVPGPTGADSTVPGPEGPAGAAGAGVPVGGTTGQILEKIDATDFNTQWADPPSGGGGGGLTPPAPSPWWRILFPIGTSNYAGGGNWIGFAEIEFQDSGGVNLSTGGTAWASRILDSNWPAAEAFNGLKTTSNDGWIPSTFVNMLQGIDNIAYNTPGNITPHQVTVWPPFNVVTSFPDKFAVQYSLDGAASWLTTGIYATTTPTAGVGQTLVL